MSAVSTGVSGIAVLSSGQQLQQVSADVQLDSFATDGCALDGGFAQLLESSMNDFEETLHHLDLKDDSIKKYAIPNSFAMPLPAAPPCPVEASSGTSSVAIEDVPEPPGNQKMATSHLVAATQQLPFHALEEEGVGKNLPPVDTDFPPPSPMQARLATAPTKDALLPFASSGLQALQGDTVFYRTTGNATGDPTGMATPGDQDGLLATTMVGGTISSGETNVAVAKDEGSNKQRLDGAIASPLVIEADPAREGPNTGRVAPSNAAEVLPLMSLTPRRADGDDFNGGSYSDESLPLALSDASHQLAHGLRDSSPHTTPVRASTVPFPPLALAANDLVNELETRIRWFSAHGNGVAEIRLDPPELGPLHVTVHAQREGASVHFSAANVQVRDLLEHSLPRLRELLENGGMNLVDVNVAHQQGGNEQPRQFGGNGMGGKSDEAQVEMLPVSVGPVRHAHSGIIDAYA